MLAWLLRRWFLLLLAAGLAAALLRPDLLRPAAERLPVRLVVGLSLLLMSWSLEGRRLLGAIGRPGGVLLAMLISYGCLPGLAVAVGSLLSPVDLRLGLLIMASVPCTLSSAVLWTRHAGGDEAVALLIVMLTNGLGWLVAPLWLSLAPVAESRVSLDAVAMMRSLVLVLVLPVIAGQVLRLLPGVPALSRKLAKATSVAARLLVATTLVAATALAAGGLGETAPGMLALTAAACVGTHLTGVFLGLVAGRLIRLDRADRIAIGFAASQKTLPVGLMLVNGYYLADYPLAVLPLVVYHAGQLLVDTLIADRLASRPDSQTP
jgi:sodium/bile acid cotransporter 7